MAMRLSIEQLQKLSEISKSWGISTEELEAEAIRELIEKYEKKSRKLAGRTAMIVEDSAMMRMMMEDSLARAGVTVKARAENGFEAVKLFNGDDRFDFVFLNVVMPAMDGVEALEDFKTAHSSRIIMVTSTKIPSLLMTCVAKGAHQILYRPFGYSDLVDVMTNDKVFTKTSFPAVELGLKARPGITELSQKDIRELLKSC